MHIEPGFVAPAKVMMANAAVIGVLAYYVKDQIKSPVTLIRTALAAMFFSVFMQSFHMPVGPSELHFVGAMAMYLTLGFVPTMIGFALGLLLQGLLFSPQDLVHLGVNSLSLIVPLIAVHMTLGKQLLKQASDVRFASILKLDAAYYTGVTAMVGFWLALNPAVTSLSAWAAFASSYLIIVACEPVFTYATLKLLKNHADKAWVQTCFAVTAKA
ncbi:MAG: energy-coupling factor ABC transporter permease [Mariprofundaceae bacterium]|nr:energy-coupling factor ABC transporter permease [Mariprofundaceae bacterium]